MIKVACHIHSEWSYDGKWPLPDLAAAFRRRGYRVLMMTEHDRGFTEARWQQYREACAQASSDELLVIPGIEYSDSGNVVHMLVWGVKLFLGEGLPTTELLKKVAAANGIAVLAHPTRKDAWKCFDPCWSRHLLGVEVWNRKTDGWAPSRTASKLLKEKSFLTFAGLDFHTRRQFFPLAMGVEVPLPPGEDSVLKCFQAGRCHGVAFGSPITHGWVPAMLPLFRLAESCRRSLATIYRRNRRGPGAQPGLPSPPLVKALSNPHAPVTVGGEAPRPESNR